MPAGTTSTAFTWASSIEAGAASSGTGITPDMAARLSARNGSVAPPTTPTRTSSAFASSASFMCIQEMKSSIAG